jgi:hypothetical protein
MQPVPWGFTVIEHEPAVCEGAVGGRGSSSTLTRSGAGAGGVAPGSASLAVHTIHTMDADNKDAALTKRRG